MSCNTVCPSQTLHQKIIRTRCRQDKSNSNTCNTLKGENDVKLIHLPFSYREPTWLLELKVLELHDRNRSSSISEQSDDDSAPVTIVEPISTSAPSMIFSQASSVTSSLYSTTTSQSSYSSPYPPRTMSRVGTSNNLYKEMTQFSCQCRDNLRRKNQDVQQTVDRNNQWGYFVDSVP